MFSQSITAQLARWALLLAISLIALHHCQPMLDVFARQAMAAGCHQHDSMEIENQHPHHSHLHHH